MTGLRPISKAVSRADQGGAESPGLGLRPMKAESTDCIRSSGDARDLRAARFDRQIKPRRSRSRMTIGGLEVASDSKTADRATEAALAARRPIRDRNPADHKRTAR